jgi:hypothetical protein
MPTNVRVGRRERCADPKQPLYRFVPDLHVPVLRTVISIYPVIPQLDPKAPAFHRNIRIENNHVDLYDYPLLFARSVDGLAFVGNTLAHSTRFEPWHPRKTTITLDACKNVLIENNQVDPEIPGRTITIEKMKKSDLRMKRDQFTKIL